MLLLVNLQAWIQHHFPNICARAEERGYNETHPAANRYIPRKGLSSTSAYRSALDRTLGFDLSHKHFPI
jgi:hypothetical protein